jgi:hypothetical protein
MQIWNVKDHKTKKPDLIYLPGYAESEGHKGATFAPAGGASSSDNRERRSLTG